MKVLWHCGVMRAGSLKLYIYGLVSFTGSLDLDEILSVWKVIDACQQ